jgi:hypothetical protein
MLRSEQLTIVDGFRSGDLTVEYRYRDRPSRFTFGAEVAEGVRAFLLPYLILAERIAHPLMTLNADATAPTMPPPEPGRDSSLSNSAALRDLAGILGMRADATRAAIAERACAEISRLREGEKFSAAEIERLRTDALVEYIARRVGYGQGVTLFEIDAWLHELAQVRIAEGAIPVIERARAKIREAFWAVIAVDPAMTESAAAHLAMETFAGAGHPEPDTALRSDLQIEE